MKKLALNSVLMILLAFLSASMVSFGQNSSVDPATGLPYVASYGYVFMNPGIGVGTTQTMMAFPLVDGVPANVSGTGELMKWNGQAWADYTPVNWSGSQRSFTLGPGTDTWSFTVDDPNGMYKLLIRSYEPGPHVLSKYWFPNGLQLSGFLVQSEFDDVSHLTIGPAQQATVPQQSSPFVSALVPTYPRMVIILGGINPRLDASYIVYRSNGQGQAVQAQRGEYKFDLGGASCTSIVTLSFAATTSVQPVFVGVNVNGMQYDQVLYAPYVQPFNPQCPQ
jgi:hypothetical protein